MIVNSWDGGLSSKLSMTGELTIYMFVMKLWTSSTSQNFLDNSGMDNYAFLKKKTLEGAGWMGNFMPRPRTPVGVWSTSLDK